MIFQRTRFPAWSAVALWLSAGLGVAQIQIDGPVRRPVRAARPATEISVPEPVEAATDKPAAAVDASQRDVLKFRNADSLHGTLVGVVAASGLRWKRPDVKDAIGFDLANVSDVLLAPRPPHQPRQPEHSRVELTNGDRLAGDIVSLNDKQLVLKTWYAGTLTIKRAMIQQIIPMGERVEAVYVGPTSLDGWTVSGNRNAWTYRKAAFYGGTYGSIAREVKLPEVATIEFDAAWRGQLSLQVGFFLDDFRQIYNGGGYLLQLNSSSVYLQRGRPGSGFNSLGNPAEVPDLQRRTHARFAVRVNKPKKSVALFVNGNLVKQWTDTAEFAGRGQGVMFAGQGQGQNRISNILIAEWAGKLDSDAPASAGGADDLVVLANGDKISGTLSGIASNEISFATSYAPLKIPLERASFIGFAADKTEKPRRQPADARAYFTDTDRLTIGLEKIDEQTMAGTSESCGRMTATVEAFSRIQFNIYQPRPDTEPDEDWGTGAAGGVEVDQ